MKYPQDIVNNDVTEQISKFLFGEKARLERLTSHNNQVYLLRYPSYSYVIKFAGKGRLSYTNNIIKEISCLTTLKKMGLPVSDILYTHNDIPFKTRPFFITPFFDQDSSKELSDDEIIERYLWKGLFIKQLELLKPISIVSIFINSVIANHRRLLPDFFSRYLTTPFLSALN